MDQHGTGAAWPLSGSGPEDRPRTGTMADRQETLIAQGPLPGLQAQASCDNQATCDMSRLAVTPRRRRPSGPVPACSAYRNAAGRRPRRPDARTGARRHPAPAALRRPCRRRRRRPRPIAGRRCHSARRNGGCRPSFESAGCRAGSAQIPPQRIDRESGNRFRVKEELGDRAEALASTLRLSQATSAAVSGLSGCGSDRRRSGWSCRRAQQSPRSARPSWQSHRHGGEAVMPLGASAQGDDLVHAGGGVIGDDLQRSSRVASTQVRCARRSAVMAGQRRHRPMRQLPGGAARAIGHRHETGASGANARAVSHRRNDWSMLRGGKNSKLTAGWYWA